MTFLAPVSQLFIILLVECWSSIQLSHWSIKRIMTPNISASNYPLQAWWTRNNDNQINYCMFMLVSRQQALSGFLSSIFSCIYFLFIALLRYFYWVLFHFTILVGLAFVSSSHSINLLSIKIRAALQQLFSLFHFFLFSPSTSITYFHSVFHHHQ